MPRQLKAPPGHLKIIGRDFSLNAGTPAALEESYGSPVYGYCDVDALTIAYRNSMDTFDTKDTVLHEVFHAIRYAQGRENGGAVEEDFVRSLATGLIGVLQDNPEFAKWLLTPPQTK